MNVKLETPAAKIIAAALELQTPVIAAEVESDIRRVAKHMFEEFGITLEGARKNAYRRWEYIRGFITGEYERGKVLSYSLNDERIASYSNSYAEQTTKAWLLKIIEKLGHVESVEVSRYDGRNFVIRFVKQGKKCYMEQQSTLKCSAQGTLFHQFPSRLYVEGQFYSERNFKALFSA